MQISPRLRCVFARLILGCFLLVPCVQASYYGLTKRTDEPLQAVSYDVRYPYWTDGIYIATYPPFTYSKEGWTAQYYGGIVSRSDGSPTLIQYASWQMGGKGAPTSGIDFAWAGKNMSWKRSNWEGSSGAIKGYWPAEDFKPKQWYRFLHRVWLPAAGPEHLGYAGVWMKDLTSGQWHHLATFKFPAELTGFDEMGGFCEHFANKSSDDCAVEFRNVYSMRNNQWVSDPTVSATNHPGNSIRLAHQEGKSSVLMETFRNEIDPATGRRHEIPAITERLVMEQPANPDFLDPIQITAATAERHGDRCVIRWNIPPQASPQLGYRVQLLQGSRVVASLEDNTPQIREAVLTLPATTPAAPLTAHISIIDIFDRQSEPVAMEVRNISALPKVQPGGLAARLQYRYYETENPAEWVSIPDLKSLKPVREGFVNTPDLTPRLRREGYAFAYEGFVNAPVSGLYTFHLICASSGQLFIDDKLVVDSSAYHSINNTPGSIALEAGPHKFTVLQAQGPVQSQQQDDYLTVLWNAPGVETQPIPHAAFAHQKSISLRPPTGELVVTNPDASRITHEVSTKLGIGSPKIDKIEYYATCPTFDFFSAQGAMGCEYFLGETTEPEKPLPVVLWGGGNALVKARVIYDKDKTFDTAPTVIPPAANKVAPVPGFTITELEHHLYPVGAELNGKTLTISGESMGLLTRPVNGDCQITARVVKVTSNEPLADGSRPQESNNWFAGIIMGMSHRSLKLEVTGRGESIMR